MAAGRAMSGVTGTALALGLGALVLAAAPAAAQQQQQQQEVPPPQQADTAQQQVPAQATPEQQQQQEAQAAPQAPPPADAVPEQPVQTGQEAPPPQAVPEQQQQEVAQPQQPEGAPPLAAAGAAQQEPAQEEDTAAARQEPAQQEDAAAAQPDEDAQPSPAAGAEPEPAQAAAPPAPPMPDLVPEKEVAGRIAEAYGVEVLSVKRDDLVGGPAYAVKVMNPPGTSNAAFQVTTLMVDAVTGELIPQFRHRTAGYQTSGSLRAEPPTPPDGTALRRRTHWTGPRLSDPGPR